MWILISEGVRRSGGSEYRHRESHLGLVEDYDAFHDELDKVSRHCFRVLVPGGRLVCVVGDVCLSRRKYGRHSVIPLHADIVVRARRIGFDNLTPILWHKITNASHEVENGPGFLGKPYEPNAIIKNDVEFILMLRKPGGYRQPSSEQREASRLTKQEHQGWFPAGVGWSQRGAHEKASGAVPGRARASPREDVFFHWR